ncbi:MAG TPA: radical SAM protein [Firmicutes bacterium]|nr:radical SAM protein [Candidatus Fermentithermobacillaceae bacterium]
MTIFSLETVPIGVSSGTASVLGLKRIKLMEKPTTAHFLFGEDCLNQCAFCAQARGSKSAPNHLSRVTWPRFSWETLKEPLRVAITQGTFKRVCVQTVECVDSQGPALDFIAKIREISPEVLISAALGPVSVARVKLFFEKGATNIGLPIDAASPEVYEKVKVGSFERAWDVVEKAAGLWPGRISTHLIVGLGETEEDAVRFLVRARSAGVTVGLFAFTPVRGTAMEKTPPPDVGHYRRVQLAAFFLKRGGDAGKIELRDGRIVSIDLDRQDLWEEIIAGKPFETSGCLYCNRPYYNERPGQVMMNYPRALTEQEAKEALKESGLA